MPNLGRTTTFPEAPPAVLVMRGDPRRVSAWVERGTVPSYVFDLPGRWCAVVPAGAGHAGGAYTDPSLMTASRPTPWSLRPSLAFVVDGSRAVCVVQQRGWRALPRWCVIEPGVGIVKTDLPPATRDDLLLAVPHGDAHALDAVLAAPRGSALEVLTDLLEALTVPAVHLLDLHAASGIEGDLVEPGRSAVRRFNKHVGEEVQERREIEELDL